MKFPKTLLFVITSFIVLSVVIVGALFLYPKQSVLSGNTLEKNYWFVLHRKSNVEFLYHGIPGDAENSRVIKIFPVKTGIPNERPTPLPELVGREYWLITEKHPEPDNPETAPYFLTLNVPAPLEEPYGPTPYTECNGQQCNWILPGAFGLHGTGGNNAKISKEEPGSSGCIRHSDEDITYLYSIIDPNTEVRYYIQDV